MIWTNVEDLPEEGTKVLVSVVDDDKIYTTTGYWLYTWGVDFDGESATWFSSSDDRIKVTHWMRLPEPKVC